ncbi:hypothetical protein MMC20_000436 [Loxospora ochrophaea]|nr:hypothetical protein [Loxospora ochrophaea]
MELISHPTLAPRRPKKLLFLLVALIFLATSLYSFNTSTPKVIFNTPPYFPVLKSQCQPIALAPALPRRGQIETLWQDLQHLFDTHTPQPSLRHRDFPGGQIVTPTFDLLRNFLQLFADEVEDARVLHHDVVQKLPPTPKDLYFGRGVVMVVGGRFSEYAATTIGMLRLTGSRLPVEAWMVNKTEEKYGWCADLVKEGVSCRFLSDYVNDTVSTFTHPYQYKAAALIFSSFSEVLFLDSDSMPVLNPDPLFDTRQYKHTGVVLWPDYWSSTESPYLPYITGASSHPSTSLSDVQTVDSGQMLWDKRRHWKTLLLSAYYNYHGPSYYYTLITQGGPGWGDKDTFTTALRALRSPFTLAPHRLYTLYYDDGHGDVEGTGIAMMQADPRNTRSFTPMFLHSNFLKFSARRMLCDESCREDVSELTWTERSQGKHVYFTGDMYNPRSGNFRKFRKHKRVFAERHVEELGVDVEAMAWTALEKAGCVGAWSHPSICERARVHLNATFGIGEFWSENQC